MHPAWASSKGLALWFSKGFPPESLPLPSASCQGRPLLPAALTCTVCHSRERRGPCRRAPAGTGDKRRTTGLSPLASGSRHEEPVVEKHKDKGSCGPPAPPQRKYGVSQVKHPKTGTRRNEAFVPSWLCMPCPRQWRTQALEVIGDLPAAPQTRPLPRQGTVLAVLHTTSCPFGFLPSPAGIRSPFLLPSSV